MTDKTCPFCNELPHNSDFDTYHGMRWCCTKGCPLYLKVISVEQWNTRGGIKQLGADEMSMPKRIEDLEAEVERLNKLNAELKNRQPKMNDFEEWWEGFSGLVALKMSIYLDPYKMDDFYKYFEQGLTQSEAMQKHYIG